MMSMLSLIEKVDNSPYIQTLESNVPYYRFRAHDGTFLGKMLPKVVEKVQGLDWFKVEGKNVTLTTQSGLSEKFAALTQEWRDSSVFDVLKGWRSELYSCYLNKSVYFQIERSAACLFGLVTYGCHITGYCETPDRIWVPRRALTKPTYPGKLDNTVAGGLGDDLGFWECAIKECYEEAGLPENYVKQNLKQVGQVTYEFLDPETGYYQPEVECVYDLKMDREIKPQPVDGEAEDFKLMLIDEVKQRMLDGEFKYNCALVLVDYFIRHGFLTADTEKNYAELIARSHRKLEYPLK